MASEVLLPKQGNTVESCIIVQWKMNEGDAVKTGDVLMEVETDKATMDVESTADGVLLKQLVAEGDDVAVLSPVAIVGEEGESVDDRATAGTSTEGQPPAQAPGKPAAAPQPPAAPSSGPAAAPAPAAPAAEAAPAARRRRGGPSRRGEAAPAPKARGR